MNILDPKFRYVDSYSTDLRKTFARIRREARDHGKQAAPKDTTASANVVTLEQRARKSAV